ncbi:hypothetical protein SHK09_01175 [Polaribacter sp. PL03]|uniref:hypothetical protein n=1 Tax=Polaribacter sp. PL03 TaxID=3088353 RepID=UPI0029CEA74E|nr:hypothetical protein [Polaribacter sp. PL03]MDX6745386.1 hypothetical protein [Polaribacter sp. PL03]
MKKNKGINLFVIGMVFSTLGMTLLADYKTLQYTAMILGLLIMIYSVFVIDKLKKSQTKK